MNESCFYNDQCLELNPGHVKARFRKVVISVHDKDFEQAETVARTLLQEDPTSEDFLGLMRNVEEKRAAHEDEIRKALKLANEGKGGASNSQSESSTPYREGPLKQLLRERREKTRQDLFENIRKQIEVTTIFKRACRFTEVKEIIET